MKVLQKFLYAFIPLDPLFIFSKTIMIAVPYSRWGSLKNTNIGQVSLAGEESTKQQYSNLTDRVNDMVEAVKHAIVLLQIAKVDKPALYEFDARLGGGGGYGTLSCQKVF